MKLKILRGLFNSIGYVCDISNMAISNDEESGVNPAASTSLALGGLLDAVESALTKEQAALVTKWAHAYPDDGKSYKLPDAFDLTAALREMRDAWYPDDFDTIRTVSQRCWWAVNRAEKTMEEIRSIEL